MEQQVVVTQEVDVIHLINRIGKRSKVSQAKILQALEKAIPERSKYLEVRSLVLDEINNLTRAYVNEIFGDIEFLIK